MIGFDDFDGDFFFFFFLFCRTHFMLLWAKSVECRLLSSCEQGTLCRVQFRLMKARSIACFGLRVVTLQESAIDGADLQTVFCHY